MIMILCFIVWLCFVLFPTASCVAYLDDDPLFIMLANGSFQPWPFVTDLPTKNITFRDEQLLREFDQWVKEDTDIFVNDAIELQYFGGDRRFGVRYKMPLLNNIVALSSTPNQHWLCGTNLNEYGKGYTENGGNEVISNKLDIAPPSFVSKPNPTLRFLDPDIMGKLAEHIEYKIVWELFEGSNSPWAAYMRILPSVNDIKTYWTYYWSEADIDNFDRYATDMEKAARLYLIERSHHMHYTISKLNCERFGPIATPKMQRVLCDQELLYWASVMVKTRGWTKPFGVCLIPYQDMYNHGDEGNSVYQLDSASSVYSNRVQVVGAEATQTYRGDLTHAMFFVFNAFVPIEGFVTIPFLPQIYSRQHESAYAMSVSLGCWTDLVRYKYHEERLPDGPHCMFKLLDFVCFSLVSAKTKQQTDEIMKFYVNEPTSTSSNTGGETGRYIWLSQENIDFTRFDYVPVSSKFINEKTGWRNFYHLMEQHRNTLPTQPEDDMIQFETGTSNTIKNIALVRLRQRNAIDYCMGAVAMRIKNLTETKQFSDNRKTSKSKIDKRHQDKKLKSKKMKSDGKGSKSDGKGSKSDGKGSKSDGKGSKSNGKSSKSDGKGSKSDGKSSKSDGKSSKSDGKGSKSDGKGSKSNGKGSKSNNSKEYKKGKKADGLVTKSRKVSNEL